MDLIRKNSSFQAIELKLVLLNSSHQNKKNELLLSQIVPKIRKLDTFENMLIFRILTKKSTFYGCNNRSLNFFFQIMVLHAEKLEENNGT